MSKDIERITKLIEKEMKPFRNRHYAYCLLLHELSAFYDDLLETKDLCSTIIRIFEYGFIKGIRYCKKHDVKRRHG